MESPRVSVIMSAYNAGKHLEESVESILSQNFSNFEFIIVDDGSTDKTLGVLEDFSRKDGRVKLITNERNIGLTKSLNKAIKASRGKYIARMDADDIAMPERLGEQVEFMEKNSEVGLVGTAYCEINSRGEILGSKFFPASDGELRKVLIKYNPFLHASVMIRRGVLDSVGLYDENIPKAQDYDLWFRVSQNCRIANLPVILMKRRYWREKTLKGETQQLKCAIRIRIKNIRGGRYPWWALLYLIKPLLVYITPPSLRLFLRGKILRKKIYL